MSFTHTSRRLPRVRLRRAAAGVAMGATALIAGEALAGFGSPIQDAGDFGIGIVARSYKRDVFDVTDNVLTNPGDTFGYLALETRMGIWADRVDLAFEVAKAHNAEDDQGDRDLTTWELGITGRGLVFAHPDDKVHISVGGHYRDTIGFDRGPTQTHKIRRNIAAFGLFARPLEIGERSAQIYVGPLYSRHEFFDFGAASVPNRTFGEGETRNNWQILGGMSIRAFDWLELDGELWYRDYASFALTAMVLF